MAEIYGHIVDSFMHFLDQNIAHEEISQGGTL